MILKNSTSFVHNFEFSLNLDKEKYTLSVMTDMSFFGHLERNALNIYPNKTCLEHKLQREKLHPKHFSISVTAFEINEAEKDRKLPNCSAMSVFGNFRKISKVLPNVLEG